jgi:DNA segregation ATPase FtsK/SpoIIIE-like protein
MDSSNLELRLSELRRELKEILSIIEASPSAGARATPQQCEASRPTLHQEVPETTQTANTSSAAFSAPDKLCDDALVIVTEFGQASPAILQMWLSIDYGSAMRILREFESQGLVSSRGKVRHKAYVLRRSKGIEFRT